MGFDAEHRAVVDGSTTSANALALLRRGFGELALVLTAPVLLLVVRYFSWGAAVARLATFCVLFGFVAFATRRAGYLHSYFEARRPRLVLWAAVALLFALHVRSFAHDIARGGECLTDMGRPSICAGEWLRHGRNPWADCVTRAQREPGASTWNWCIDGNSCIDWKGGHAFPNWTHHGSGFDFMDGYKYGPITALLYAPFAHALRERGLYVVNFACWLLQCAALVWLARRAYPGQHSAPARALLILLLPLVIPSAAFLPRYTFYAFDGKHELSAPELNTFVLELTQRCSNDIIPVVLALAALILAAQQRWRGSGIALGLSLAAKQLPGLLLCTVLPALRDARQRAFWLATLATTALAYLPFLVWSPRELIANLLLFSVMRPTNSSSVRAHVPASLEPAISLVQLGICGWLAFRQWRSPARDLSSLLRTAALMCIAFVALNKVVHGNYLLWLQPLLALTLAGRPYAATDLEARAVS